MRPAMSLKDQAENGARTASVEEPTGHELDRFLAAPMATTGGAQAVSRIDGVRIGTLIGFADGGVTPLVAYADQLTPAAQPARATLELRADHIGRPAVLMFEEGDPSRPIVVGCLREANVNGLSGMAG